VQIGSEDFCPSPAAFDVVCDVSAFWQTDEAKRKGGDIANNIKSCRRRTKILRPNLHQKTKTKMQNNPTPTFGNEEPR
jgi:hypothetical protein